jgi:hypothetical protein
MLELMKRPSAFIPLFISAGFLAVFVVGLIQGTLVRQPDEDAGAQLFQILMPLQFLIIVFFAISWLPKLPKPTLQVLALQVGAALSVIAIVYLRHL